VAFALDMYGQGKVTDSAEQAGKWAREIYSAPAEKGKVRFDAGLEQLRSHSKVDPTRIAAIGYCFGGSVVLEMARLGADVNGVVSFHGGLDSSVPQEKKDVKASVLVCTGASDKMVPPEQVEAFGREMTALGADWYLIAYGGAVHSFTNPAAAERAMDNVDYDPRAAARSWRAMLDFFTDLFAK
jgi:dienelactone hydrolase